MSLLAVFIFWEDQIILKSIMFIDDVHVNLVCRTFTKRIWRFSKVVHVYVSVRQLESFPCSAPPLCNSPTS